MVRSHRNTHINADLIFVEELHSLLVAAGEEMKVLSEPTQCVSVSWAAVTGSSWTLIIHLTGESAGPSNSSSNLLKPSFQFLPYFIYIIISLYYHESAHTISSLIVLKLTNSDHWWMFFNQNKCCILCELLLLTSKQPKLLISYSNTYYKNWLIMKITFSCIITPINLNCKLYLQNISGGKW